MNHVPAIVLVSCLAAMAASGCSETRKGASKSADATSSSKKPAGAIVEQGQARKDQPGVTEQSSTATIRELEEKERKAESAAPELAKFQVKGAKLSWPEDSGDPSLEMTVTNGLSQEIAKVYFNAEVTEPGRSTPLVRKSFSFASTVGLKPGESATWDITGTQMANWGLASNQTDLQVTVTPTRIDGPDGKTMIDGEFSAEDQEKLRSARQGPEKQ